MGKNLVIFDGSNFYHKSKKLAPHIHLTNFDYRKLAEALSGDSANDIEYCVGEIKRDRKRGKVQVFLESDNKRLSLDEVLP